MKEIVQQIEWPPEVLEKMQSSTEHLIEDADMLDLKYVDVKNKKYRFVKRVGDIAISIVAIILLFIPSLIISIIIYKDDPGKVLFRQNRVGYRGKSFHLYKFRTMKLDTPKYLATIEVLNSEPYITKIGKILRKYSIDEIPQFYNVLKGEMSLIGPRPLIADEYEIHLMRMKFGAYNVRPGITGLAQINGRDTVSATDKVHFDVMYLTNFSFKQDLKILKQTLENVIKGKDVLDGSQNGINQYNFNKQECSVAMMESYHNTGILEENIN